MENVGIRDVARHAGVSIGTVSHVINNTKALTPETIKRVMHSIEVLGYRPNATARSFKTGKHNLIAFIVPDIANAFFSTLIEEVEAVMSTEGYKVLVVNTKETKSREIQNIDVLSSGFVDGLLIASTLEDFSELSKILPSTIPSVFVDRQLPSCPCDTIIVKSGAAMEEGILHLIKNGHKKIGYITGLLRISTTIERLDSYTATMKQAGLYNPELIRIGDSMSSCVSSHLESLLDMKCTAIVASNNIMAIEAMMIMLSKGLNIGRDIELLGFKDSEQVQYGLNLMNLIYQPTIQFGRIIGERMIARLKYPSAPVTLTTLDATFLPRS